MYTGPGIYYHYKGGHYLVFGVAQHEARPANKMVIYRSYDIHHEMNRATEDVDFVARPLESFGSPGVDAFNDMVVVENAGPEGPIREKVPRFRRVA